MANETESELVFEVLSRIGAGGQADVFLLRLRRTGGLYAGKFPREIWDPFVREQFCREAMRQARIAGPHVVPIIAWNLDVERPFVVLEYMPHGSLADEIARQGRFGTLLALQTAREIAVTVADLHGRGVIHRDLKPGNILRAPDGSLKLNDLGLGATMSATEWISAPGFLGTPGYAAPEQLLGFASPRSDVFALGVILQELLTGTSQLNGTMLREVLGAAADRIVVLVARMCAQQSELRPTASEAIGLLDECILWVKSTAARTATPVPAKRSSGQDVLIWGGAALATLAMIANRRTWDPSAGRYRGRDGRFK